MGFAVPRAVTSGPAAMSNLPIAGRWPRGRRSAGPSAIFVALFADPGAMARGPGSEPTAADPRDRPGKPRPATRSRHTPARSLGGAAYLREGHKSPTGLRISRKAARLRQGRIPRAGSHTSGGAEHLGRGGIPGQRSVPPARPHVSGRAAYLRYAAFSPGRPQICGMAAYLRKGGISPARPHTSGMATVLPEGDVSPARLHTSGMAAFLRLGCTSGAGPHTSGGAAYPWTARRIPDRAAHLRMGAAVRISRRPE